MTLIAFVQLSALAYLLIGVGAFGSLCTSGELDMHVELRQNGFLIVLLTSVLMVVIWPLWARVNVKR